MLNKAKTIDNILNRTKIRELTLMISWSDSGATYIAPMSKDIRMELMVRTILALLSTIFNKL